MPILPKRSRAIRGSIEGHKVPLAHRWGDWLRQHRDDTAFIYGKQFFDFHRTNLWFNKIHVIDQQKKDISGSSAANTCRDPDGAPGGHGKGVFRGALKDRSFPGRISILPAGTTRAGRQDCIWPNGSVSTPNPVKSTSSAKTFAIPAPTRSTTR